MPKTPLRYPGGKSRAVETIMPYIRDLDCGELCSPFLGGGSIELKCAEEGMVVHGYDLFQPLVWFWEALLSNPQKLLEYVNEDLLGDAQHLVVPNAKHICVVTTIF